MPEWWTYRLSDFLMYSPQTWARLVELYNLAVWPMHLPAMATGLTCLAVARAARQSPGRHGQVLMALLAPCWAWVGWAFHHERQSSIDLAANAYGIAFGVQALLLTVVAVRARSPVCAGLAGVRTRVSPRPARLRRGAGLALLTLGVLAWPAAMALTDRPWSQVAVFGLMPDPTVVATLGALLLLPGRLQTLLLWPIPIIWCAIAGATAWTLGNPAAWVMPACALGALCIATSTTYVVSSGRTEPQTADPVQATCEDRFLTSPGQTPIPRRSSDERCRAPVYPDGRS